MTVRCQFLHFRVVVIHFQYFIEFFIIAETEFQIPVSANFYLLHKCVKMSAKFHEILLIGLEDMSRLVGKPTLWFLNRSDTNRAVQAQKMVRDKKFWIQKLEELYFPHGENCEADLRLCICICRLCGFS